jgi:ubiquinone/menaquinone biosynthesis C-methylase UbiE
MENSDSVWRNYSHHRIPGTLELFPVFFKYFAPDFQILDLGCGSGRICLELADQGYARIVGLDINHHGLSGARTEAARLAPRLRPRFVLGDALAMPFPDGLVQGLIMQAVLTTMPDPEKRRRAATEAARVLHPQGLLYLAAFGQTWSNPLYRDRYEAGLRQGFEPGTFFAPNPQTGQPEYLARHFTRNELVDLWQAAGLATVYYGPEIFVTRTGNKINGHVLVLRKECRLAGMMELLAG